MNIPLLMHVVLPASLTLIVLADALPNAPSGPWMQVTALGLLGWLVWYLIAKTFPAHTSALLRVQTAFLAETRESREQAATSQHEFCQSIARLSDTMDRMEEWHAAEHRAQEQHRDDCRAIRLALESDHNILVNQRPAGQAKPPTT